MVGYENCSGDGKQRDRVVSAHNKIFTLRARQPASCCGRGRDSGSEPPVNNHASDFIADGIANAKDATKSGTEIRLGN